ncbi:MAG TPA: hypothetical protein VGE39_11180 [Prosthecobacter sp.]
MNTRKPAIGENEAIMLAIQLATARGMDVGAKEDAHVSDRSGGHWWTVWVPDRVACYDPGGCLIRVHKQTGVAEMDVTL